MRFRKRRGSRTRVKYGRKRRPMKRRAFKGRLARRRLRLVGDRL